MVFAITQCRASEIEIRRLLAISRSRNHKRGVSGCMFWTGAHFAQVLEGVPDQLGNVLRRIGSDGRQSKPRVLYQSRVDTRQFAKTPLGFLPVEAFSEAVEEAHAGKCTIQTIQILLALLTQEHFEATAAIDPAETAVEPMSADDDAA